MTDITSSPTITDQFETGYLDGELAAETGLTPERASAIADMADEHDATWATGYYEGYWARHAVNVVLDRIDVRDETNAYLDDRDTTNDLIWASNDQMLQYARPLDTDATAGLQMRRDGLL